VRATMVKFTQIARLIDGLPLCATTEDWPGSREFKKLAKDICRMLTSTSPARLSITAGTQIFHYAIESEVIYMVLCDKGYPKANAFAYLSDIQSEFAKVHGDSVATQARPYAFIAFEQYIDKTKRRFNDSGGDRSNLERGVGGDAIDVTSIAVKDIEDVLKRGVVIDDSYNDMMHRRAGGAAKPQSTLQKVNNELSEVHRIMGKNIEQVLDRGENLDGMYLHVEQMDADAVACGRLTIPAAACSVRPLSSWNTGRRSQKHVIQVSQGRQEAIVGCDGQKIRPSRRGFLHRPRNVLPPLRAPCHLRPIGPRRYTPFSLKGAVSFIVLYCSVEPHGHTSTTNSLTLKGSAGGGRTLIPGCSAACVAAAILRSRTMGFEKAEENTTRWTSRSSNFWRTLLAICP